MTVSLFGLKAATLLLVFGFFAGRGMRRGGRTRRGRGMRCWRWTSLLLRGRASLLLRSSLGFWRWRSFGFWLRRSLGFWLYRSGRGVLLRA